MRSYSSISLPILKDKNDEIETRKSLLDLMTTINAVAANRAFGDTDAGDYTEFGTNGFQTAQGAAVCWNDIIIPAASLKVGATAPTFADLVGGIFAYRFDAAKSEAVHSAFEIPHDYKQGSDIDLHVHWCPTTTDTGNIAWLVDYAIADVGEVVTLQTGANATVPAPGVVNQHVLTDIVSIRGTNLKIGAVIPFKLFRLGSGADTFTGNAFLLSVGAHYQSDTLGSRLELSK